MHTSRQAWDDACTKDLEDTWKIYARLPSMATVIPTGAAAQLINSDETFLYMLEETRMICGLQQDLAKWASRRFAEDGFERRWKALAAGDRKNVILEGLYRTMCLPDMDDRRNFCPDSTSEYLTSQNGDAFLRMLKEFLPAGRNAVISEPIHIPHPIVDRLLTLSPADEAKPGLKVAIQLHRSQRTYCLTTIVWNTCLAFVRSESNTLVYGAFKFSVLVRRERNSNVCEDTKGTPRRPAEPAGTKCRQISQCSSERLRLCMLEMWYIGEESRTWTQITSMQ
ncbi:hypothetical protein PHLCEN_2v7156 [Hermanssonia centrifuga]|uniref:Uncharacterized protein n=1 Tax=Hermanssonia centrifuga TaxID=98765 RepID=A0A2R6NXE6_9APHY|nr:hypothetical protein PHLCEN_2v7156 [Hermanssonia centrifuga]